MREREYSRFLSPSSNQFPSPLLTTTNAPFLSLQTLEHHQDVFEFLRPQDDPSVPAGLLRLHRGQDHHLQGRRRLGGKEAAGRHRHTGSQISFFKVVPTNVKSNCVGHLWAESCITRLLSPFFKKGPNFHPPQKTF